MKTRRNRMQISPPLSRDEQARSVQETLAGVRKTFAAGGLDAVLGFVETTFSKLQAEKAQQQEAFLYAQQGQPRSGSEKGPHGDNGVLNFWETGKAPDAMTSTDETATPASTNPVEPVDTEISDDRVDEATGLRASELERLRCRGEALEAEIAEHKEKLKRAQREQREAAAKLTGDKGRPTGRNRQALHECPMVVVEVPYEPDPHECICQHCSNPQVTVKTITREWIEFVPGHYELHVMKMPVTRCSARCDQAVLTTPRPPVLLNAGGMMGDSLIAQAVASKFADRIPVNHQLRMNGRANLVLAESTVRHAYSLGLETLHETFAETLRSTLTASSLIQLDPTSFRVLDAKADGGSKRGTVTGFLCDRLTPYMEYHSSGSGESVIWNRLKGYTGNVLCDGSNIFDRVFNGIVAMAIAFFCNCRQPSERAEFRSWACARIRSHQSA